MSMERVKKLNAKSKKFIMKKGGKKRKKKKKEKLKPSPIDKK